MFTEPKKIKIVVILVYYIYSQVSPALNSTEIYDVCLDIYFTA